MLELISEKYNLVLSSYVLGELEEVVKRKFNDKISDLNYFLYNLSFEIYYTLKTVIDKSFVKVRNVKDEPVLYSAIMSDVDILITGDKAFDDIDIEKPVNLTPSEFMENY